MPDFMKSLDERLAAMRAEQRDRWEASGTTLTFDAWRQQEADREAAEAEDRRNAEMRAEAHARRVAALVTQIPGRYRNADIDDPRLHQWAEHAHAWSRQLRSTQTARPVVVDWADAPRRDPLEPDIESAAAGPSLLLLGPTGVGKTYAAFGALRRYVEAGGSAAVKVATAADLYAELRPRPGVDSEDVFGRYAKAPVLFIDDLGAAKSSEWVEEINYRLINYRWNHQLATLITSNVPPKQLGDYLGERVASRLTGMCERVVLKGVDRRAA
jgi:DNA replication protein DnaC